MTFTHAFGFLVVGVISGLLPRWFPAWCPPTGLDGTSTRELWLQLMCAVQVGLAGIYFLGRVGAWFTVAVPYTLPETDAVPAGVRPSVAPQAARAVPAWRPAMVTRNRARSPMLPIPVAFKTGLLDQRAA